MQLIPCISHGSRSVRKDAVCLTWVHGWTKATGSRPKQLIYYRNRMTIILLHIKSVAGLLTHGRSDMV